MNSTPAFLRSAPSWRRSGNGLLTSESELEATLFSGPAKSASQRQHGKEYDLIPDYLNTQGDGFGELVDSPSSLTSDASDSAANERCSCGGVVRWFSINLKERILMCDNPRCFEFVEKEIQIESKYDPTDLLTHLSSTENSNSNSQLSTQSPSPGDVEDTYAVGHDCDDSDDDLDNIDFAMDWVGTGLTTTTASTSALRDSSPSASTSSFAHVGGSHSESSKFDPLPLDQFQSVESNFSGNHFSLGETGVEDDEEGMDLKFDMSIDFGL